MAVEEIFKRVPTAMVAWAFVVLVLISGVLTGYSIVAWHLGQTFTVAGYDFGRPSVGVGAVVPYDAEKCPKGWTVFRPASSRFIIGSGGAFEPGYENDSNGSHLTVRGHGLVGGAEQHRLSVTELPGHHHTTALLADADHGPVSWGVSGSRVQGITGTAYATLYGAQTSSAGNDEPHNNMPPFIPLLFCKKGEE